MKVRKLELRVSNNLDEIRRLKDQGFCPVECAWGQVSVVDDLIMDHHNEHADLMPVAYRAYNYHFGDRADDPRFVTTGAIDADCCFATAALAGIIPHPSRGPGPNLPELVFNRLTRDFSELAYTIAQAENFIKADILAMAYGKYLIAWNALAPNYSDELAYQQGVGLWRTLLEANSWQLALITELAQEAEKKYRMTALAEKETRAEHINGVLVIKNSQLPGYAGFKYWFRETGSRFLEGGVVKSWPDPVAVNWYEQGNVIIACPTRQVAEELFGQGGLMNVSPKLEPPGWGGRINAIGSPRGLSLTWEQVKAAAGRVAELRL